MSAAQLLWVWADSSMHWTKTVNFLAIPRDTSSVWVQIYIFVQIIEVWSPLSSLQSSSRSLNRATEDYFVRTIWLCFIDPLAQWRGGDSPLLLSVLSLHCVMLPHFSFSLRTGLESKSQMAGCWFLRSWLNRSSGTTCWFGVCAYEQVCIHVTVHVLGTHPTNCAVQQKSSGCGQLISVWAQTAGYQPFCVKIRTHASPVQLKLLAAYTHLQYILTYFMQESKLRTSFWLSV